MSVNQDSFTQTLTRTTVYQHGPLFHAWSVGRTVDEGQQPVRGKLLIGSTSNDPGVALYFVTPYIVVKFSVSPETLSEPFSVSTPIGDPVIARRVYRNCPVTVSQEVTSADLVELEMVDLDVILGIDCLTFYSFFVGLGGLTDSSTLKDFDLITDGFISTLLLLSDINFLAFLTLMLG
ncbi:hypothetical protein MTR67_011614 [Solanum verrucosum]|uniref:Uncharacterized protein n=1 Tax=Solanum verrucosum TaxID=315347 RepID=A0AAF0QE39_SOLVR|nr:hypothetical protein MTR67_011614 [Solanum verrucosum]